MEPMNGHGIITLELCNEFLLLQDGRCIRCGYSFAHCQDGNPEREFAMLCECCFDRVEGLICVQCNRGEVVCTLPQG
jgi:hypothetical protein